MFDCYLRNGFICVCIMEKIRTLFDRVEISARFFLKCEFTLKPVQPVCLSKLLVSNLTYVNNGMLMSVMPPWYRY